MNRSDFLRHLGKHSCSLMKEGGRHSLYRNDSRPDLISAVPRHTPLRWNTVLKICKELGIPKPTSR